MKIRYDFRGHIVASLSLGDMFKLLLGREIKVSAGTILRFENAYDAFNLAAKPSIAVVGSASDQDDQPAPERKT